MALKVDNFIVRPARSLDDLQWMVKLTEDEGWRPRVSDAECYFTAGLVSNCFIGELNGKRISCSSLVTYGSELAFYGFYIVLKQYRGQGYGNRTWDEVEKKFDPSRLQIGLDAVVNMASAYEKRGYSKSWTNRRYDIEVTNGVKVLAGAEKLLSPKAIVSLTRNADIHELAVYDSKVFGAQRENLLAAWITVASGGWVVLENNEIVGYLILRKTVRFSEEGYRAAPFFADDLTIAKVLFKAACEFVLEQDATATQKIAVDIPVEFNTNGVQFYEHELSGESVFDTIHMTTKGVPDLPLHKVFSLASLEIG